MKTILLCLTIHLTVLRHTSSAHITKVNTPMKPHSDWARNYGAFNAYTRSKANPNPKNYNRNFHKAFVKLDSKKSRDDDNSRKIYKDYLIIPKGLKKRSMDDNTITRNRNSQKRFGKKVNPLSKHIIRKRWAQSGHESHGSSDGNHGYAHKSHGDDSKAYGNETRNDNDHYRRGGSDRHDHYGNGPGSHRGHSHGHGSSNGGHGNSYRHNSRTRGYKSHGGGPHGYRKSRSRHDGHGRGGYGHHRRVHHKK